MGKNSTKVNSFKVIQGDKAEGVMSTRALTHKDTSSLLMRDVLDLPTKTDFMSNVVG